MLNREHWRIENSLHSVRDVTFGEDHCRVRRGGAPQLLAALRDLAISLLNGTSEVAPHAPPKHTSHAEATRHDSYPWPEAIALLHARPPN